jgi:hypothetical protein
MGSSPLEAPVNDAAEITPRTAEVPSERRFRHAPLLRRAVRIALLVGTCLAIINQGDAVAAAILHGIRPGGAVLWKIPLTYAVPFLVSWYSSIAAAKSCQAGPEA